MKTESFGDALLPDGSVGRLLAEADEAAAKGLYSSAVIVACETLEASASALIGERLADPHTELAQQILGQARGDAAWGAYLGRVPLLLVGTPELGSLLTLAGALHSTMISTDDLQRLLRDYPEADLPERTQPLYRSPLLGECRRPGQGGHVSVVINNSYPDDPFLYDKMLMLEACRKRLARGEFSRPDDYRGVLPENSTVNPPDQQMATFAVGVARSFVEFLQRWTEGKL